MLLFKLNIRFAAFLPENRGFTMKQLKKVWTYFVIVSVALLSALNYQLLVFPNQFAPSGLNGICTMIQYVTGISVGFLSLLINIPLAILVFFYVSRPVALRSMVYVVVFSVGLLVLGKMDLSAFAYTTENGTSRILGPLTAGIIMGFCYSVLIHASAYTGGTDFVSAAIHKKHPEKNVFSMIFAMNACVAMASYFVYGYQMEPVIMCILYSFASTTVGDHFLRTGKSAVRFEIVTDYPEEISQEIIHTFGHSATKMAAVGMYKREQTNVLMCVVNRPQAAQLAAILRRYPHTFSMMSPVDAVVGNFKKLSDSGKEIHPILDEGDGQTL